jgi:hypothetical protein
LVLSTCDRCSRSTPTAFTAVHVAGSRYCRPVRQDTQKPPPAAAAAAAIVGGRIPLTDSMWDSSSGGLSLLKHTSTQAAATASDSEKVLQQQYGCGLSLLKHISSRLLPVSTKCLACVCPAPAPAACSKDFTLTNLWNKQQEQGLAQVLARQPVAHRQQCVQSILLVAPNTCCCLLQPSAFQGCV